MALRIVVDRALCDGNGLCGEIAPAYLALDDNDELLVLREVIAAGDVEQVERAAAICPKAALALRK